ncbi:MAG TPA: type VI secretion system-associated protein TagF [Acidocella sp.]|nr:type VI secretion system-associated protein TagF [Acidocella sp.]HQU03197.1 type VI secretion system-associated protein TagF [Acidocella sp.]
MGAFQPAAIGFFGKLPARGDFVRANVPEDFVAPWDEWCRRMLTASRTVLGEAWLEAWMEAPVWHFLLPPGACGPQAVLGVWLPSMDKVGRHFPFLACALAASVEDLLGGAGWLLAAEAAGLAGVVEDAEQGAIAAMLDAPTVCAALDGPGWWTDGSPQVKSFRIDTTQLLPVEYAGAMLRDMVKAES